MTSNKTAAEKLYAEGLSYTQIATRLGCPLQTVAHWIQKSDVPRRSRSEATKLAFKDRHAGIRQAVVDQYGAGESELAVAQAFGVSRPVITRLLRLAGVPRRGKSDAECEKWTRMTAEQRARQVLGAHEPESRAAIAVTRFETLCVQSPKERPLVAWLKDAGVAVVPQHCYGVYNIDVAILAARVAIELECRNAKPWRAAKAAKRIRTLQAGGWRVVIIWATDSCPLSHAVIHPLLIAISSSEPLVVLRGNGDFVHV